MLAETLFEFEWDSCVHMMLMHMMCIKHKHILPHFMLFAFVFKMGATNFSELALFYLFIWCFLMLFWYDSQNWISIKSIRRQSFRRQWFYAFQNIEKNQFLCTKNINFCWPEIKITFYYKMNNILFVSLHEATFDLMQHSFRSDTHFESTFILSQHSFWGNIHFIIILHHKTLK